MQLDVENAITVVLHNFLLDKERGTVKPELQKPSQCVQFMDLRSPKRVITIYNQFADFFCITEGKSGMAGSIHVMYSVVSALFLSLLTVFNNFFFPLN